MTRLPPTPPVTDALPDHESAATLYVALLVDADGLMTAEDATIAVWEHYAAIEKQRGAFNHGERS